MIHSITVTNHLGDSIKLELTRPDTSGFIVGAVEGLGPTKADINTAKVASGDGGSFNSARRNERNVVLTLIYADWMPNESIEDIRHKSYKYFPTKKKISLLIETDNRTVKTEGYVESNDPIIFSKREGSTISIICPDPNLYSAGLDANTEVVFYGVEPVFEFPFSNESLNEPLLEMTNINRTNIRSVVYDGDTEIGVTITIRALGPAENIAIRNFGTNESMNIDTDKLLVKTGSGITAGDTIVVNTARGHKGIALIRNGVSTNILNCLSKDTDWFQLVRGNNVFSFDAISGVHNLEFTVEHGTIYEGV